MSCYSVFIQFRLGVFPSNICTLHLTKFNAIWILKKTHMTSGCRRLTTFGSKNSLWVFVHPYPRAGALPDLRSTEAQPTKATGLTQPKRLAWWVRTAPPYILGSPTINFRCETKFNTHIIMIKISLCPKISAILTHCICPKISALLVAKEELSHWYWLQLCYVGSGDEEDVFHLFFNCPLAQTVGMHWPWTGLMIKTFTPNWRMEGFMLRIVFSYRCS